MSQVIKCTRLLPNACRLIPRYSSTQSQIEQSQKFEEKNSKYLFGAATGFGTFCFFGVKALAKEAEDDEDDEDDEDEEYEDEDEEEMSGMIEESLADEVEVPSDGMSRFDKWAATQERYLLVSEAKRAEIELRDVAPEELVECDALFDAGKLTACEDLLIELNTVSPSNDEVLWRLARIKWVYGKGYQTSHQHKVFHVAHSLACQAAAINPDNGNAHRWIAILGYYRAEKEGVKAGVLNMEAMKYHLDKAIECNPDDNVAWTLLGNWYFELADMSRLQRRWSKTFAGVNPPAGSHQKALDCFLKSDSIKPWIMNTYQIAKAHLRLRNKDEAIKIFTRLRDDTEIVTCEDYRMRKESRLYIDKLTNPSLSSKIMNLIFDGYLESYRIPFITRDTMTSYTEDTHWNMFTGKEYTV